MKKTLFFCFMTSLVLLSGTGAVIAQDKPMLVIPVELFACTYNDGQGPDDLDKVIKKWNAWADKTGVDAYSAWTLTPYYFSQEQEFDVIWLGAAKDAIALGKIQDSYLAEKDGLHDDFNEVVSCNAHLNFASLNYKALPKGETPANAVLTFSDCKNKKGTSYSALKAAMDEWTEHQVNAGSNAAIFHWYPAYGGGKEEYSFKWIEAYENLAELGADYERYGNGGGVVTSNRLFNHLIDCDSTRAYLAQSRRYVQLR